MKKSAKTLYAPFVCFVEWKKISDSLPVEKRDRSLFSMFHISYGARVK